MRLFLYDAVPMSVLFVALYATFDTPRLSSPRVFAVGIIIVLFRMHAVWIAELLK